MQVEVVVKYMEAKFGRSGISGFGDILTFQIWPHFPFEPWTIVHGSQKTELAQKIMQVHVEVDEICMCTTSGTVGVAFYTVSF